MLLSYRDNKKNFHPVLLIHGTGSTSEAWNKQYEILSDMPIRVIGIDLRGHGNSKNIENEKCSTQLHINDIKETLEYLNIKAPMTILGHSYGAVLAVKYAEIYPEDVMKLLLVGMPTKIPFFMKKYYDWLLGKPIEFLRERLSLLLKLPIKKSYKIAMSQDINIIRQIWEDSQSWDFLNNPPQVQCPIHFSVGQFDYIALKGSIERLYKKFPNSSYTVFPFASHDCMEDQPSLFNNWVLRVIS